MGIFRKTGFLFFFMLMITGRLLAFPVSTCCSRDFGFSLTSELPGTSEIQNSVNHVYHAIEQNNSSPTFTEVHRLASVLVLPNRVLPVNFNFRGTTFVLGLINVRTLVPIFIRGHALLN
jgi:hypothetical protein